MSERLLIVDDEELNREIIREYLEDDDYELVEVPDGEQALAVLAGDRAFDAVLLDRMMPGIDGIEVLRRMKADPRLAGVPVILQTAAAGLEQVAEGLRLGAYYYLTKPYHRDALSAVVHSVLDTARERRELARGLAEYHGVMYLVEEARYRLRTLDEARALAAALASACAERDRVAMGLLELLVNAVEHGNLGITFEEKAVLLEAGAWQDEVAARLASAQHAHKRVEVVSRKQEGRLLISIRDEGTGFDASRFLELDESRAFYPNGRGITLARQLAFESLEYLGCGNEVRVSARCASFD